MNTEIICAMIAVAGTVVSALLAWFVSRLTANKEIERLKLSWEREDVVTSDDEFAEMTASVAQYVSSLFEGYDLSAQIPASKVAAIRSRESGALADRLDTLYQALLSRQPVTINDELTLVIQEKRNRKCAQHTTNG